jgi:aspartate kinase
LASEESLAKVSVVGIGMLTRPGYAARMFASLGDAGIPIKMVSISEIQVTCVVPADRAEDAVRSLHRTFDLHPYRGTARESRGVAASLTTAARR